MRRSPLLVEHLQYPNVFDLNVTWKKDQNTVEKQQFCGVANYPINGASRKLSSHVRQMRPQQTIHLQTHQPDETHKRAVNQQTLFYQHVF